MAPSSLLDHLQRDALITVLTHLSVRDWGVLAVTCKALRQAVQDDTLWHGLALAKWGHSVNTLAAPRVPPGQWHAFCSRRMASVPPHTVSPLDLVQERFCDPWSHIACCLLCTRTSGGPTIRNAHHAFLLRWPTPSAVLDGSEDDMLAALRPLGLQAMRLSALRNMSRDFLAIDWEDPSEFKGCGKFVSDSWRIFCRGVRDPRGVTDTSLSRYLNWAIKGDAGEGKKAKRERGAGGKVGKRKAWDEEVDEEGRAMVKAALQAVGRRQTRSMGGGGGGEGGRGHGAGGKGGEGGEGERQGGGWHRPECGSTPQEGEELSGSAATGKTWS